MFSNATQILTTSYLQSIEIKNYVYIVCRTALTGKVDCSNKLEGMESEGNDTSCDPDYINITSEICENNATWSGELPPCIPLNCSNTSLPVPANGAVLQLPSCGLAYQSQCAVSCDEGFTGDNVTYLCNVTSDPTMVDWVPINNTITNLTCSRG